MFDVAAGCGGHGADRLRRVHHHSSRRVGDQPDLVLTLSVGCQAGSAMVMLAPPTGGLMRSSQACTAVRVGKPVRTSGPANPGRWRVAVQVPAPQSFTYGGTTSSHGATLSVRRVPPGTAWRVGAHRGTAGTTPATDR